MRKFSLHGFGSYAVSLVLLAGCGSQNLITEQIAEDSSKFGACENFNEKVRATLTEALVDGQNLPDAATLEEGLRRKFSAGGAITDEQERYLQQVVAVFRTLTEETQATLGLKTPAELLEALVALEIGDRTTPERAKLVAKLDQQFKTVHQAAGQTPGVECQESPPPAEPEPAEPVVHAPKAPGLDPVLVGALRVMTTSYQNCATLELPPVSASTPNVKGITVTGNHSSGRGLKREVSSLSSLNQTHYYVKEGIERPSSCFDVTKKPLIYDFGGKPYASTADNAPLDFHKNAGSGTSVLGYDCSGYVFSSLAASGLRLAPGKKLKASLVYGVNARMMMNPSSNGLGCLANYQPSKTNGIKSGDILASTGHVVILEVSSPDPLGLNRAKSASDCTTSKLTHRGFNFEVLQSAPVKNGMGLDRMRAADYLEESSSMRTAMVKYAVSLCKAKFGQSVGSLPSEARIVRHKQTSECKDRQVELARESCVSACYSRAGLW